MTENRRGFATGAQNGVAPDGRESSSVAPRAGAWIETLLGKKDRFQLYLPFSLPFSRLTMAMHAAV